MLLLAGCSSVGGLTGAIAGAASGSVTANPAVGVAVGIGVKAGVDESINYLLRYWTHEEQMRIASVVGELKAGQIRAWAVHHKVPYDNKEGQVTVVRIFETPLATCKEALFSVDDAEVPTSGRPHFIATICRGARSWNWAVAEPAVQRWGALQ
ncbi:hypothetical protein SFB74_27240 [Variovorax sp. W6]